MGACLHWQREAVDQQRGSLGRGQEVKRTTQPTQVGGLNAMFVDLRAGNCDDGNAQRNSANHQYEFVTHAGGELLRIVKAHQQGLLLRTKSARFQQHRSGHERPRQGTTPSLVDSCHEALPQRTIVREECQPGSPIACGRSHAPRLAAPSAPKTRSLARVTR